MMSYGEGLSLFDDDIIDIESVKEDIRDYRRHMEKVQAAGYYMIPVSQKPSRRALRKAGFTGKIPFTYWGTSTNAELALTYKTALDYGMTGIFQRTVMLNYYVKTEPHEILERFGIPRNLTCFLKGDYTTEQRYQLVRLLIEAFKLLGVKPEKVRNMLFVDNVGVRFRRFIDYQKLSLFQMNAEDVALFLVFNSYASDDNIVSPNGFFPNWNRFYSKVSYRNYLSDSLPSFSKRKVPHVSDALFYSYSLQELKFLLPLLKDMSYSKISRLISLRLNMDERIELDAIIQYLKMPESWFNDFFPNLTVTGFFYEDTPYGK